MSTTPMDARRRHDKQDFATTRGEGTSSKKKGRRSHFRFAFCLEICLSFFVEICDLNPGSPNHFNSQFRKLRSLLVHLLLALNVKERTVDLLSLLLICLPQLVFKEHSLGGRSLADLIFGLLDSLCRHSFLIFGRPKYLIFYIHLV